MAEKRDLSHKGRAEARQAAARKALDEAQKGRERTRQADEPTWTPKLAPSTTGAPTTQMPPEVWREQVARILAETGLDEQELSELRGHPDYMAAWKEGGKAARKGIRIPWETDPHTLRTAFYRPHDPYEYATYEREFTGRTPPESAQKLGGMASLARADNDPRFTRMSVEELGRLEGEMAAIERHLRAVGPVGVGYESDRRMPSFDEQGGYGRGNPYPEEPGIREFGGRGLKVEEEGGE